MRTVLKLGASLLVIVVLLAGLGFATLYLKAARSAHPVGYAEFMVPDPQDKPLKVAVWYPTDAAAGFHVIGLSAQRVAVNGPVVGRNLPLVVISHGNGGVSSSHSDTALALASAGFVVAAVNHTGDNAQDDSYVGSVRWLVDRPRHIHQVLDYMLGTWPASAQIDAARVGMFGFSAGGFTALVSIGGVPDLAQIAAHCAKQPEFACTLWKPDAGASVPPTAWVHDPRIRAAVIAAPGFGFAFEPDGLSQVTAAVQLWNGAEDASVPYATNEAVVRRLLRTPPEYHAVPGAGHFAFIAPCPTWLFPLICKDPQGFDREAFHRDFNEAVIAFFRAQLSGK